MAQKCVHQGCGKTYADADEVCRYHPGPPVFHEGQKGMTAQTVLVCDRQAHHAFRRQDGRAASRASSPLRSS
jgi:hypothetical protein